MSTNIYDDIRKIDEAHQEAKKVNFCYDQVAKLGIEIIHPQRPVAVEPLPECSDFDTCGICPAGFSSILCQDFKDRTNDRTTKEMNKRCPDCGILIHPSNIKCDECFKLNSYK